MAVCQCITSLQWPGVCASFGHTGFFRLADSHCTRNPGESLVVAGDAEMRDIDI